MESGGREEEEDMRHEDYGRMEDQEAGRRMGAEGRGSRGWKREEVTRGDGR